MNKSTIILLALFITLTQQGARWPDVQTGKITPITSFSGNSAYSNYSYTITHTISGAGAKVCLALISYDAILSTTFTFNSTILALTTSTATISIQTYSTTYFNILSYHYLITTHPHTQINNLCYYTSNLYTGTGIRTQNFTNATTTQTGSLLMLVTVITGAKIVNTNGLYFNLQVVSYKNSLPTIVTEVTTKQNNLVQWVCVAIIVYNPKTTLAGQFYFRQSSYVSYTLGFTLVPSIDSNYNIANTMFFGLSMLQLSLVIDNSQQFIMSSGGINPLNTPTINQNQQGLILEQLYLWTDACIGTAGNAVPTTGTNCTVGCAIGEYKDPLNYCKACSVVNGYCLTCTSTDCLTCDSTSPTYRSLNTTGTPDVCVCMTGYFDSNGVCTLCSNFIDNCTACINSTYCTLCDTNYTAVNGVCACSAGTYFINNTCVPLMGCLSYNFITSGYYCSQCDTANYFYMTANSTCLCLANTIYNSSTGMCEGNCSDGISLGNHCDLGSQNGVNGSGCSSTCVVTPGYYCSNPSTTRPSICVISTNYSGTFLYATRDLSSNTANIYIEISPNDAVLSQIDFSQYITTSIPTSAISASYNSNTGILAIFATYSESIQGTTQMLNISFDYTKIYAPSIVLYPLLEGVNAKLEYGVFEVYNNIIYYLAMFAGGLSIVFAIVSGILGFKLIGFQICLPAQITYFSLILVGVPQASISSLYGLSFSTGYNQLEPFNVQNNLNQDKGLIVLQKSNDFINNCNFSYAPLIVLIILAGITRIYVKEKTEEQPKKGHKDEMKKKKGEGEKEQLLPNTPEKQPEEMSKGEKAYYFIVDKLLVNFWVLLLLNTVFAFGIQLQSNYTSGKYSTSINIALALLVLTIELMGLSFIVLKIKDKDKTVTFRSRSKYYPVFYIVTQMTAVLIMTCTYFITTLVVFAILLPQFIIIFFYIRLSPHGKFKSFVSITGLYCQLLPVFSTIMFVVAKYMSSPMMSTVFAFCILGLYIIGEGLSIARLVIRYRQDKKKQDLQDSDKVKVQAQNLQAMTYNSIKNQLMSNQKQKMNWEGGNQAKASQQTPSKAAQYQKLQSRDDSEQEEKNQDEQDQLKKLKKRLKKQIFQKRTQDI